MNKPVIYISRKLPKSLLEPYSDRFTFHMWDQEDKPVDKEELLKESKKADGLITMLTEKIDDRFLRENPQLKIIANLAVGFDNIDIMAAKKHHIIVTNTPDVLTETTADLTFALLMATARRMVEANDLIKQDGWEVWSPFFLAGSDVHHKTIGIVGMGRIGEAVARRARGFDMRVLYHNRSRKPQAEKDLPATYVNFDELLTQSDFVVSLIPATEQTKGLFNHDIFLKMKTEAIFINASRGAVVNELDLASALENGVIKGAGLDVFSREPIGSDHTLLALKNAVCLPHIGSATVQTRKDMVRLCLDNLDSYFYGDGPKTPVQ
ncbi:2-hydroxyacid dehydrogenase [Virgibacillus halophilus]|uniref:2-hydroxyacid dehydrogenase n=1 Tax=Tigheibacillus halophilus TaxID=361280 RepID=UPI00362BBD04